MSENLFFSVSNLMFTLANLYYALYGAFPRFSALCFGICLGATLYTFNNYLTVG